jgi:hypothetical protein
MVGSYKVATALGSAAANEVRRRFWMQPPSAKKRCRRCALPPHYKIALGRLQDKLKGESLSGFAFAISAL